MAKKKPSTPPAASAGRRRKPPRPLPTRAELLQACQELRSGLIARRKLLASVPRRGYSPNPTEPRMPLVYRIPSCGAPEVLRLITEGKLEVISSTLIDALIAELKTP